MLLREGWRSFYKGSVPPICGAGFLMSIAFTSQQHARRLILDSSSKSNTSDMTLAQNAICGCVGGLSQTPFANVIELLKVRLQCQGAANESGVAKCAAERTRATAGRALNLRQMFVKLWKTQGPWFLTRGYSALALRDVVGYGFYFSACEVLMRVATPEDGTKADVSFPLVASIGVLGGVAYWIPIMPLDTIKSRLHADGFKRPTFSGAVDCATKSIRAGGVGSLYRGLALTVLYSVPKNAAKYTAFEGTKRIIDHSAERVNAV